MYDDMHISWLLFLYCPVAAVPRVTQVGVDKFELRTCSNQRVYQYLKRHNQHESLDAFTFVESLSSVPPANEWTSTLLRYNKLRKYSLNVNLCMCTSSSLFGHW